MDEEIVPLPKKAPFWFKTLFAAILIGAVIGTWSVIFRENVLDIIQDQLEAIRQKKITEAYYSYMSQEFQKNTSLGGFKDYIRTHSAFENYATFLFEKRSVEDGTTIIEGILIGVDKSQFPIQFKLIKEDDKWKILSINLLQPIPENPLTQPPTE